MRSAALVLIASAMLASGSAFSRVVAADARMWAVDRGDVRVVCPLTVGGSFEAKTTSIAGTIGGELAVDLRTLDTGIGLRNEHLRTRYLETSKGTEFERAVVSDVRLAGGDPDTFEGKTKFTGMLTLHGTRRAIEGQVQVRRSAGSVRIEATFAIMLTDYGIAKPQYLGVGVKNEVQVKVAFVAMPAGTK